MIACTQKLGRLGNQLFEYAFLRAHAKRLAVQFYWPEWLGDQIFDLHDSSERTWKLESLPHVYHPPRNNCGYDPHAMEIVDGTQISGNFQSERYFDDKDAVRKWFAFKDAEIKAVKERFADHDLQLATALHLRLTDYIRPPDGYLHCRPELRYFSESLEKIDPRGPVLVFSDDAESARRFFAPLERRLIFVAGNRDYEDLYLLSRCRNFVCSASTFSWWGAWLSPFKDKKVYLPREWFRPGYRVCCEEICPPSWNGVRSAYRCQIDYRILRASWKLRKIVGKLMGRVFRVVENSSVK